MSNAFVSELSGLALPLTGDAPCGVSVEYDADFLQLEEEAQGKPEVEYGSTLTQATPPNWKLIRSLALPMAQRSRDLRVAVYLTRAELNVHGVAGFTAGLSMIEALLKNLWDGLHPQLDPEDDNDPQLRVNILAELCGTSGVLPELRDSPLVKSAIGTFSLRDIDFATGELAMPSEQEKPSLSAIDAAFQQADSEAVIATHSALTEAFECSVRIEKFITEKVGFSHAIDLSPLSSLLRRSAEAVRQRLPQSTADAVAPTPDEPKVAAPVPMRGEIASRDDVRQALDRICTYFAIHEPTSPVPLLLQRARKLVDLNFIELLQDLAPDGLGQLSLVSGIKPEERSDD